MSTDLFGASFTEIGGFARGGQADITFIDNDATTYTLVAMNVSVVYNDPVTPIMLPGGKVLIKAGLSVGAIQIGALLGKGVDTFLSQFGGLCQMESSHADNADPLKVKMVQDASCDSSLDVAQDLEFKCYNNKITKFGGQTQVQGVYVRTNLQLFSLNIDLTAVGA